MSETYSLNLSICASVRNAVKHSLHICDFSGGAALGPDDLKRLLLDNIDKYFDDEIRERVLSDPKHQPKNIRRLVHKRLTEAIKG